MKLEAFNSLGQHFKAHYNIREGQDMSFAEAVFDTVYPYKTRSSSLRFVRDYRALRNQQKKGYLNKIKENVESGKGVLSVLDEIDNFVPLSSDFLKRFT